MSKREIKFRGKKEDNGEWVYGSLIITSNSTNNPFQTTPYKNRYQMYHYNSGDWNMGGYSCCHVAQETIGQFTGLLDKNGVEIYEGDICLCDVNGVDYITIVYFELGTYYLQDNIKQGNLSLSWFIDNNKEIEVIGNIHDNPELLTKIGRR